MQPHRLDVRIHRQAPHPVGMSTRTSFRLRVGGFAPWGCEPSLLLSRERHSEIRRELQEKFPPEFKNAYIIEEGYRTNWQFLVRLPLVDSVSNAFVARQRLQDGMDEQKVQVHDKPLEVRLEPDAQRRLWLQKYFAVLRGIGELRPGQKLMLETEIKSFPIYHKEHPQWLAALQDWRCQVQQ